MNENNILDVPFVSQLTEGALRYYNDCGAASVVMLLRAYRANNIVSVDEVFSSLQKKDEYLSAWQLRSVLTKHLIKSQWMTYLSESDLREAIGQRKPMVVLFNYKIFRQYIDTEIAFNGFHFAVLTGIDDEHVYLNDPLWRSEAGKDLPIPIDAWMDAWTNFPAGTNPPRGAIVPDKPLPTDFSKFIQSKINRIKDLMK